MKFIKTTSPHIEVKKELWPRDEKNGLFTPPSSQLGQRSGAPGDTRGYSITLKGQSNINKSSFAKKKPRKTEILLTRKWDLNLDKKMIKAMFDAGLHRGDSTEKWNPNMAPYIQGEFKGKHIINLAHTLLYLEEVCQFLEKAASKGKKFLFVGTQNHSSVVVKKTALATNSFFVNEKWLGGMLTNWKTAKRLVRRLNFLLVFEKTSYIQKLSKKELNDFKKEKNKLKRYFLGLRPMKKLPGVVILASQNHEINAVRECQKLEIPSVTILDTNCDPALADYFIPGNDDSYKSLNFLFQNFRLAIKRGRQLRQNNLLQKQANRPFVSLSKPLSAKK